MNSDPRRARCLGVREQSRPAAGAASLRMCRRPRAAATVRQCHPLPRPAGHRRPLWVLGDLHLCFKVTAPRGAGTTGPKGAQEWGSQAAAQAQLAPAQGPRGHEGMRKASPPGAEGCVTPGQAQATELCTLPCAAHRLRQ